MKENMKLSDVFKEAANLLGIKYNTCCDAIGAAQGFHYSVETKAKRLFIKLFKPNGVNELDCWMGDTHDPDAKQHRIWAMLFMAEITKRMRSSKKP
jgi:hypothetical protein